MIEDRPLNDDEYPHLDDELPRPPQELDPISAAVGTGAYVYRHLLEECVEQFDGQVARFPERFDRFYFDTPGGPLLIDILEDATEEQRQRSETRKRVAFKRAWCAEHGRRYLVLGEDDAGDVNRVRAMLATLDEGAPRVTVEPEASPVGRSARRRGQVQRPKAAAGQ